MVPMVDQPHQRQALEHAQLQAAERLGHPAYTKGKISRPMIERKAASGRYFRVNIVEESEDQMHVCFPAYDTTDVATYEWIWRTSSRIHRASNGKWVYAGRGAWKYNVRTKKKRGRKGVPALTSIAPCPTASSFKECSFKCSRRYGCLKWPDV